MQFNKVNNIKEQYRSAVRISLKAVVVSSVWPGHMLMCFLSHMAALVGDLAGPYFFPLLVLVTGAWTPGVGAHVLVAGIASLVSATRSRGWMVGFQWKPLESIF